MIRKLITGAAVLGVATALSVVPAEAAAYGVTLKTSTVKADLNKTFTLSGKVTGSGAGSKSLIVQRKVGSGGWSNYSTVTTRSTGTYSKSFTMPSVGAKSFRVLAPKKGSTTTGTSNAVGVTGYTWLTLIDQPTTAQDAIVNVTRTVQGVTYRKSILLNSSFAAVWNLGGKCDIFKTGVAVDPLAGSGAANEPVEANTLEKGVVKTAVAKLNTYTALTGKVSGVTGFTFSPTASNPSPVDVLTPKVHCATTALPEYYEGSGTS